MLCDSDNTAADRLTTLVGGYHATDTWLQANQIKNLSFGTDIRTWLMQHMIKTFRYTGTQQALLQEKKTPVLLKCAASFLALFPQPATIDFSDETTNLATPHAMTSFIKDCYEGKAPGMQQNEYRELLFQLMRKCRTGLNRIPKYLPSCTIAHKTGSGFMGICNDAGIIESKDKDPIALTIFVKDSVLPMPELEETIARTARDIYHEL
jgi:beta-lactamase class A